VFGISRHAEQLVAGQGGFSIFVVSYVVMIFFFLCTWVTNLLYT